MTTRNDYNRQVVEEFRANGGKVGGMWEGTPLLLLTTTGARSGERRITPMGYLPDGDRLLVWASNGGAPTHPDCRAMLSHSRRAPGQDHPPVSADRALPTSQLKTSSGFAVVRIYAKN